MITATQDEIEEHDCQPLIEKPLINQLDIADGLKGVLISSGFTVRSLLTASASDFVMLGIDPYVAKLVRDAVKKVKT